jgi:hypothetical protein
MEILRDPRKPFIARDTKEPLVVMGGYHVGEDGGLIRKIVDLSHPIEKPEAKPADIELLKEHGLAGLKELMWFGVIDRLQNSKLIDPEP